jgi:hypothetical protein
VKASALTERRGSSLERTRGMLDAIGISVVGERRKRADMQAKCSRARPARRRMAMLPAVCEVLRWPRRGSAGRKRAGSAAREPQAPGNRAPGKAIRPRAAACGRGRAPRSASPERQASRGRTAPASFAWARPAGARLLRDRRSCPGLALAQNIPKRERQVSFPSRCASRVSSTGQTLVQSK